MKALSTTCLTLLSASFLSAEPAPLQGRLIFPNGDSLSGLPTGVTEEGFLLWKSDLFATENSSFRTRAIDSIQLFQTRPSPEASTIANITFQKMVDKNFDVIEAELLGFNDQEVKLDTWYAGELTLKRTMLHSIDVTTKEPAIFNGPGRLEDWNIVQNENAWSEKGKSFLSSDRGSIAREFPDLPDQVHFEFDLSFESSPYLQLYLFADSGFDRFPRNGYSINIQQSSMRFLKVIDKRSVPLQMNIMARPPAFKKDQPSHIDIFVDRKKGDFSLYLDEVLASSTSDPAPLTESHWLHFATLQSREQRVSNFAIRPWSGILPKQKSYLDFREELPGEGEKIDLKNGDTIIGKATSIEDGKLKIETEYLPISVPINRLSSFQVTNEEDHEKPRMYNGNVRAHFHTGGHITLRLSQITPTSITGYSQVFGEATFNLHAFTHIEFNPHEPEAQARRHKPF